MDFILGLIRFAVKIAVGIGIVLAALIGGIFHIVVMAPTPAPVGTTTTRTAPAPPAGGFPAAQAASSAIPTSHPLAAPKKVQTQTVFAQTTPVRQTLTSEQLNAQTREALVNIECTTL